MSHLAFLMKKTPNSWLIHLVIRGPSFVFPPPTHTFMSPKRVRQLSSSSSCLDQSGTLKTGSQTSRKRELLLDRETIADSDHKQIKKARFLDPASGLQKRLQQKPVKTPRLPETQVELKKLLAETRMIAKDPVVETYCSSDENSTSSEFKAEKKGGRHRGLQSRKKGGLKALVDYKMEDVKDKLSPLENAAVTERVRIHYTSRLADFMGFVKRHRLATDQDVDMDLALVMFFNERFMKGEGSYVGDYTLAALMDQRPEYGRLGHLNGGV